MLYQSNLPSSYWCYAFSPVIYLINRLPSSVLAFKSPWELLFHSIPPLSSLKTFGCACFSLFKPYTDHKLQPKSTQCIFLGYPPLSKGYICFDPHSHKVYITPHVIFNESDFLTIPTGQSDSSSSSSSVHLPLDLWISNLLSSSSPSSFSDVSDAFPSVSSSFPVSHQSSDVSITSLMSLSLPLMFLYLLQVLLLPRVQLLPSLILRFQISCHLHFLHLLPLHFQTLIPCLPDPNMVFSSPKHMQL